MKNKNFIVRSSIAFWALLISTAAFATPLRSDLPASDKQFDALGVNQFQTPYIYRIESEDDISKLGGFNELLPYVIASPNQDEAGSCLYMAITGIAEWWMARLHPKISRSLEGPIDLSARYIMNIAGLDEDDTKLPNWRTDAIYLFNDNDHKTMKNSSYRFTKGWYLGEEYSDHLTPATSTTPRARYGTLYNWIDLRPQQTQPSDWVELPEFEREVLFADPNKNQWNVAVAPDTIAETVKEALRTRKAPVMVVYNQNSYWHTVYIIGFNDEIDNGQCHYTEAFRTRIQDRFAELTREAAAATDPVVKKAYEIRAKRAGEAYEKIEKAYATRGGCSSSKGVFYIRDSIYPDFGGPIYDYDLTTQGEESPYAKKIVFKEYDWLRYFANNISVIYTK